ncbi:MAG: amidase [Actinomycetaceae bacterium]|nr:amidase [Actinomycetaceae bacterium]MDY6082265.1 amidase [Actinomycetaceae bacterium]
MELTELSAVHLQKQLRNGTATAREVTEAFLDRAQSLSKLHAFHLLTPDRARARARQLDKDRAAHPEKPLPLLWGIPIADKDVVNRAGVTTTFGSRAYADFVPNTNDPITDVLDFAGAVSIGKTAVPEFAMNGYTENMLFDPPENPWAPAHNVGGSSGGAAAAVSAHLLPVAPGNDGGGSIRIPAAACGIVGLKPGRHRLPADSMAAPLGGFVTSGPLGRNVADTALMFDAMMGRTDAHSLNSVLSARSSGTPRLRIGFSSRTPWTADYEVHASSAALDALDAARGVLTDLGHTTLDYPLPYSEAFSEAFMTIWHVNMATLELTDEQYALIEDMTRWAIESGRKRSGVDVARAMAVLLDWQRRCEAMFNDIDVFVQPTLALPPRPLGWFSPTDPALNFRQQVQYEPYTAWVNVAGLAAVSLPVALIDGLPMSVQLIAPRHSEDLLLALASQVEDATESDTWEPDLMIFSSAL